MILREGTGRLPDTSPSDVSEIVEKLKLRIVQLFSDSQIFCTN